MATSVCIKYVSVCVCQRERERERERECVCVLKQLGKLVQCGCVHLHMSFSSSAADIGIYSVMCGRFEDRGRLKINN